MTATRTAILLLALGAAAPAAAETTGEMTEHGPIEATVVASGLSHPWGMDFLPDGAIIVTEREGTIRILRDGQLSEPLAGVPDVAARGQGGLLDIALAPDFASTGEIYFTFSEPGRGGAGTALGRAVLVGWDGASPRLDNVETIFSMEKKTNVGRHFGSRIAFSPDGTVFLTTGDRGEGDRAQDFGDHAGAVIRVNRDGSVPADNPFLETAGAKPELWSKGHRNLQGAAIDPATGDLWTVEHGAMGGDEINRPQAGRNYGWPVITYGVDYSGAKIGVGNSAKGYEQPLHYWDPSIAPSGLAVYRGGMFPDWDGDLLVGALKDQMLVRLDRDADGNIVGEERMLVQAFGRIRDVTVAPDGAVWLLTDEDPGSVIRIVRD